MSFDLYFVRRKPGQSWDDAMNDVADVADEGGDGRALRDEDHRTWARIAAAVDPLVPDAEVFSDDCSIELTHLATGLQLSLISGELSLSVPYWYDGDDADRITDLLRRVVEAVERETGLTAYDPQADAPFLAGGIDATPAVFDQVRRHLDAPGPGTPAATPPAPKPKRRWWRPW